MKVEVSIIKRPGVRVEVTPTRRRRSGYCVEIPVRIAREENECDSAPFDLPVEDVAESETAVHGTSAPSETTDPVEFAEDDNSMDFSGGETGADPCDEASAIAPDEEDLLALIAEEEAEMQALLEKADSIDEETDDKFDKVAAETENNVSTPVEQYVRYFDRSTSGERVEVVNSDATGQEIVCVDGESGRISRVCGFIRNHAPKPSDEEAESFDEE